METKHTPTRWTAFTDDSGSKPHTNIVHVGAHTALVFAIPGHDKREADIQFMLRAANSHQGLVEALQDAHDDLAHSGYCYDHPQLVKIRVALALAKGEQA